MGAKELVKFDFDLSPIFGKPVYIEVNGEQHYRVVYNNPQQFEDQQMRDYVKFMHCKILEIPFLIVKYDQIEEIEELLDNFLDKIK